MSHDENPSSESEETTAPIIYAGLAMGALAVVMLYWRVLEYPVIQTWDDGFYLFNHVLVGSWWDHTWWERITTPDLGYPSPIPTAVYAALSGLGDAYVPAVRAIQLAAHVAAGWALFGIVRRRMSDVAALFGTVLWWVHPAAVETVAWATNLKTSLFGCFALASVLAWQKYLDSASPVLARAWAIGAVTAVVGASGCRPEAIIIPLVWTLLMASRDTPESLKARVRRHGLSVAVASLVPAVLGYVGFTNHSGFVKDSHLSDDSTVGRIAEVADSVRWAVQSLVVPLEREPIYATVQDPGALQIVPGTLLVMFGTGLMYLMWRRGLRAPAVFFACAAVAWLPYSNIAPLPRWVCDTYLYIPSAFFISGAVGLIAHTTKDSQSPRTVAVVAGVLASIGFGVLSAGQVLRWESATTLFAPVIEEHPSLARPYTHVAFDYWQGGDVEMGSKVLDLGRDAFETQQLYPFWGPQLYLVAGRPADGVSFGLAALKHPRTEAKIHGPLLIAMTQSGFNLSAAPERDQILEVAAELAERTDTLETGQLGAVGFYLLAHGQSGLAERFIVAGASRPGAPCTFWTLADAQAPTMKLPPRSAGCAEPN